MRLSIQILVASLLGLLVLPALALGFLAELWLRGFATGRKKFHKINLQLGQRP